LVLPYQYFLFAFLFVLILLEDRFFFVVEVRVAENLSERRYS